MRERCESAQRTLNSGNQSRPDLNSAWSTIVRCGDQAVVAIAGGMSRAKIGSGAYQYATTAAWDLSDGRLLDSVRRLARDVRVPVAKRTDAILLLAHYVVPDGFLLTEAGDKEFLGMAFGIISDGTPLSGSQLITYADRVRAVATMRLVGTFDPNPRLRRLATRAALALPNY